ncbi:flavin monoamine oxidase family protein [Ancylobacter mangrovi]|uniref:flavin monoamine oxidase family protein n=1 Tax=Ancylobacter mangrovi TaxID=2972472 RepID=UPI002162BA7F|nr:NAD(P)/FAD-dependent oxidoreductase [Ancylobacter mangrovi]MCS0503687.1 FAD-dependent oxidoreductase [Ancylobacter mangrovi]
MAYDADIAIIGAGAAGVGAARRLAGTGLSVLVLEALPRVGGRAWTREAAGIAVDLGCGWLHSADRNPWCGIAEQAGFAIDRSEPGWGAQFGDLGAPAEQWRAARQAFDDWSERLAAEPPASDRASDALEPGGRWTAYLQALSGYISGDELERISARDYLAYSEASTYRNWRARVGYGTLIASSLPADTPLRLATPVEAVALKADGVALATPAGTVRCRAAIVTASTHVLAGDSIAWPAGLDPWREAATRLPLGRNEKLFLEIVGTGPFEPETHVLGAIDDPATGAYYIRPLGRPVIECFLGGTGARTAEAEGHEAAYARAIDELAGLFGASVRGCLRPFMASEWAATPTIGGGYSYAQPGCAPARLVLARPFEDRLFFAGEATHPTDFSTAHGAYETGLRAASEAMAALTLRPSRAGAGAKG